MKTILRIILILLVASIVAGGFYLAANNSSIASNTGFDGGDHPIMTDASGQTIQPMERADHEEGGTSLTEGLGGVAITLVKIASITLLVTLIQKAFEMLKRRNVSYAQ